MPFVDTIVGRIFLEPDQYAAAGGASPQVQALIRGFQEDPVSFGCAPGDLECQMAEDMRNAPVPGADVLRDSGFGQVPDPVMDRTLEGEAGRVLRQRAGIPTGGPVGTILMNPVEIAQEPGRPQLIADSHYRWSCCSCRSISRT